MCGPTPWWRHRRCGFPRPPPLARGQAGSSAIAQPRSPPCIAVPLCALLGITRQAGMARRARVCALQPASPCCSLDRSSAANGRLQQAASALRQCEAERSACLIAGECTEQPSDRHRCGPSQALACERRRERSASYPAATSKQQPSLPNRIARVPYGPPAAHLSAGPQLQLAVLVGRSDWVAQCDQTHSTLLTQGARALHLLEHSGRHRCLQLSAAMQTMADSKARCRAE